VTTKSTSLIVHRALDVKIWMQRPPSVEEARPARCPRCDAAGRPARGALGLHGHGLRDRQVRGPLDVAAVSTTAVIACRRYLCVGCGAVVTVVLSVVARNRVNLDRPGCAENWPGHSRRGRTAPP